MKEITLDLKLQRKKKSAIDSVIIFLVLFVGVSIFQISWNIYRFRFAKDGLATLVDGQLVVGVEKIYRGEEATQIFQKLSSNIPKPEEGNEFVLLKIKIKNISWCNAKPRYMEFRLYTNISDKYSDSAASFYHNFPTYGEYKILDTSSLFKPGEVIDGLFGFEIKKETRLTNLYIERSSLQSFFFRGNKDYKIPLTKSPLQRIDYLLLYIFLFYLLTMWAFIGIFQQRKRKSDGSIRIFIDNDTAYYIYPLLLLQFWVYSLVMKFFTMFFVYGLLTCVLIVVIHYFVTKRRYLIQFCWLKKEDQSWLIEEFTKRMNWENPYKVHTCGTVEINNVKNQDTFIFTGNNVRVKNPTQESKKAKEVLLDIFSQTAIDWYSFYQQIQKIQTMFTAYFVLYLLLVTLLF